MRVKHWWDAPVATAIRQYPELVERRKEGNRMNVTGNYSGLPRGPAFMRPAERAALRPVLSPREEDIVRAVDTVVAALLADPEGVDVYNMAARYYWSRGQTARSLADSLHLSERTVNRYCRAFAAGVARELGYGE